jgi:hypothetical protein
MRAPWETSQNLATAREKVVTKMAKRTKPETSLSPVSTVPQEITDKVVSMGRRFKGEGFYKPEASDYALEIMKLVKAPLVPDFTQEKPVPSIPEQNDRKRKIGAALTRNLRAPFGRDDGSLSYTGTGDNVTGESVDLWNALDAGAMGVHFVNAVLATIRNEKLPAALGPRAKGSKGGKFDSA